MLFATCVHNTGFTTDEAKRGESLDLCPFRDAPAPGSCWTMGGFRSFRKQLTEHQRNRMAQGQCRNPVEVQMISAGID